MSRTTVYGRTGVYTIKQEDNGKWSVTGDNERPDEPGVFDPYYEVDTQERAEEIVRLIDTGRWQEIGPG